MALDNDRRPIQEQDQTHSWPELFGQLILDFTRVLEAEARLMRASIEPTLTSVLEHWAVAVGHGLDRTNRLRIAGRRRHSPAACMASLVAGLRNYRSSDDPHGAVRAVDALKRIHWFEVGLLICSPRLLNPLLVPRSVDSPHRCCPIVPDSLYRRNCVVHN